MRRVVAVVDDNELTRALAGDALAELGYEPALFSTCESALAAFERSVPAACLVDQVLPGMRGVELVRAVRASSDPRLRALKLVAFTASPPQPMLDAGADAVLRKPFKLPAMAAVLRELFDAPSADSAPAPTAAPAPAPKPETAAPPAAPAPGLEPGALESFASLHARARANALEEGQLAAYRELRSELSRVLAAAQEVARGTARRGALRVHASHAVTLERGAWSAHGTTGDLSVGGFSTVVSVGLAPADEVAFALGAGRRTIRGRARVASVAAAGAGKDRLGLAIVELGDADRDELEALVLEGVLAARPG